MGAGWGVRNRVVDGVDLLRIRSITGDKFFSNGASRKCCEQRKIKLKLHIFMQIFMFNLIL